MYGLYIPEDVFVYTLSVNLKVFDKFFFLKQWQVSEDRKSRIASLRQRQRDLKDEFTETKQRLLEEQKRWSYGCT